MQRNRAQYCNSGQDSDSYPAQFVADAPGLAWNLVLRTAGFLAGTLNKQDNKHKYCLKDKRDRCAGKPVRES